MPEQHAHCELCQTTINKYLLLQILNMEAGSSSFHWLSRYKDTFALAGGIILHPLQLNCLAFKPSQKQGPGGCSLRLTALAAQVHKKDQICARSMSIKQPNLRQKKNSVCTSKHRMAGPDSLFHQLS